MLTEECLSLLYNLSFSVHEAIYFYWIGIYKTTDSKQGWGWIDGTTYDTSWTLWANGQPRTNDEVATMFFSFTNTKPHWTGVSDKKFKNKFICKYGKSDGSVRMISQNNC